MNVEFLDETVLDERAIRRLAASRGLNVNRLDGTWNVQGVLLDDDDAWSVLQAL